MATHEKDPAHVEAGKKAAETLKQEYGQDVYHKLGHMGGLAAAEASHERARQSDEGKDPIRVEAGKHAAETRKEHEGPDVFQKMGHMGGEAAHHHAGTAHGSGGHGHTTGHAAAHGTAHGAGHGTETEKDPIRVEAGKHAAETRKEHEGQDAFQQMGHMGGLAAAKASHQRALESDDGKDPSRVEAGKHAAETRKEHEGPDVFQKMGEKGAQAHWHPEQGK